MTEILFRLRLPVLLTKVVGLSTLTGKLCCFHLKDVRILFQQTMEKRDRASGIPALYETNECDGNEEDVT